jgi:hypothetical protein
MASKARTPIATLAIVEETPAGPRARFTLQVFPSSDMDERAARAEALRARFEAETGNPVRINTHAA